MKYAEDYIVGKIYDLGCHTITSDEIVEFASKYDPQGYHLSDEAGRKSFFGGLVASGWNAACIWMNLYVRELLEDSAVEGSPGVDELRWLTPIRPGDVLKGQVEILNMIPSLIKPDVVTIKKKGFLICNDESKPACTLILNSRFRTKQSARENS